MTKQEYITGIKNGDKRVLSKAITLAESQLDEKYCLALEIIEAFPVSSNSKRIGITGTPGAGKSTFIDVYGSFLVQQEPKNKIAVLSIDPSSSISGGSILGDKTRMGALSKMDAVYIRPSASGKHSGGLARSTRLAILLCEAAGYNTILIESVGVGQGETEIRQLCDLFLLILNPGGGDELQGIKRGIVEMADILVVNKADGETAKTAELTAKEYKSAQHLLPATDNGWKPKVLLCSALMKTGFTELSKIIDEYFTILGKENKLDLRNNQHKYWVFKHMEEQIQKRLKIKEKSIDAYVKDGILPERIALNLSKDFFN